ncbi:hypothetical protein PLEOSDRAFT_1042517 [Pleurotus ostreatus PC15]|uniref:Conserved oligomeric Golgi complex subunit 7 n=1 Tax=Pleurotus ostreatus (strain PC15) TaxID=1137138 RepID=A0A067NVS8_PLEO1|nr:hypothetical protein PLEOSDRAFT_1042517 [Pleurotus ostreatus PC15]
MSRNESISETIQSLESSDSLLSWINDTLGAKEDDLAALDQHITHIVAALDIACEETSFQLERIIDDVSRGVPRLTYDLHFMKDSAMALQSVLVKTQDHSVSSLPAQTNETLEHLRTLDAVKRHMESAREVLREAESWSSLEMEVTGLLGEGSYARAAERLSEASKSMVVFQNTPEYESRRTLMVSLQNQLEASLSSALVAAINTQDVALCRNYFTIFSNIQRESEFRNYYNGSRRAPLTEMWQDLPVDTEQSISQSFAEFLPKFYSKFLTLLNAERVTIPSVFPDPQASLSNLIVSVLTALQPSFSERLAALFEQYGSSALANCITTLKVTQDFAVNVEKVMDKVKFSTPSVRSHGQDGGAAEVVEPAARERVHRRRSSRMSISWRAGSQRATQGSVGSPNVNVATHDDFEWGRELFQPYLDYQVDYGKLELKMLQEAFDRATANEDDGDVRSDKSRLLREAAVDLFSIGEESFARCLSFTYGYGAVGLVQALDTMIELFFNVFAKGKRTGGTSPARAQPSISYDDFVDLDYSAQDWADLQHSLHFLGAARAIHDRLLVFEAKLRSTLLQIASQFHMAENDPINFTVAPTKVQELLLQQSLLNSSELRTLLDSVQKQTQLAPNSSPSDPILLHAGQNGLFSFVKTCQVSMQETILSPLRKQLQPYPTLSLWSASGDKSRTNSSGISDLQVPTFSLSPSEIVQKVSEGLLNLPRLFEVYANDDALSFSLETLPYINPEVLKGIPEEPHSELPVPPRHIRRTSLVSIQAAPTPPVTLDAETVSSAWLSSLGHSLLSYLMNDILPKIPSLSEAGAAQLTSDLSYLSNILGALNVSSEDLGKWQEYVGLLDADGGRAKLVDAEMQSDTIFQSVARMRGWSS